MLTLKKKPKEQGVNVIKQDHFTTTEGPEGERVILESLAKDGKLLRQNIYFFADGESKFLIVCTTLVEGGEAFDRVLEDSMKTFSIERQAKESRENAP